MAGNGAARPRIFLEVSLLRENAATTVPRDGEAAHLCPRGRSYSRLARSAPGCQAQPLPFGALSHNSCGGWGGTPVILHEYQNKGLTRFAFRN